MPHLVILLLTCLFWISPAYADNNDLYQQGLAQLQQQKYEEAIKKFQEAGLNGHTMSQTQLGLMYLQGLGVEPNITNAVRWFILAGKEREVNALYYLGYINEAGTLWYNKNMKVPVDYPRAAGFYTAAAEQGHAQAQYRLGMLYKRGAGVKHDPDQAAKWLQSAARQKVILAMLELAQMHWLGDLGKSDATQAAMWILLIDDIAPDQLPDGYAELRRKIWEKLSKTDIFNARNQATAFAKAHF